MVSAEKKKIAKKAAVSYLGLSSSTTNFPKGVSFEIIEEKEVPTEEDGFFDELKGGIAKIWRENVGTMSKVPRMSNIDFAHYVNQLRAERGAKSLELDSPLIERWMKMLAASDKKVVLCEIKSTEGRRLLLVKAK